MVSVATPSTALSKDGGLASALSNQGGEGSRLIRQIKREKQWNEVVERENRKRSKSDAVDVNKERGNDFWSEDNR